MAETRVVDPKRQALHAQKRMACNQLKVGGHVCGLQH
jgi:hypothetical protein